MRLPIVLLLAFTLTAAAAPAQYGAQPQQQTHSGPTQWHEPNGRYTIQIPAGWQIDDSQGNLKITSGDAWAIFDTTSMPGGALAVAQRNANQMKPMVSDWKVFGQGPYTAAGHPAAGVTVSCSVPTRSGPTQRVLLFTAMAAGNDNYVTMTASTDMATGKQTNATLSTAFESIKF